MKQDLSLDFQFNSSIKQVWDALTDSDKLAKWVDTNWSLIMKNVTKRCPYNS